MKLIHAQIFGAAMAVLLVGSVLWSLGIRSDNERLEQEKAVLQRQLDQQAAQAAASKPDENTRRAASATEERLRTSLGEARAELEKLRKENEDLREAIARLSRQREAEAAEGQAQPARDEELARVPGDHNPEAFQPPAPPPGAQDQPPAPPRPAQSAEPWGAASDSELDAMSRALELTAVQRDEVRTIIMDGQDEFNQRLIDSGQPLTPDLVQEIGEEISQKLRQRIDQLLFPEQKAAFREYMERLEGEQ